MEGSQYQNKLVPYLRMVCLKNNALAPVVEKVDNAVKWINLYPSVQGSISSLRFYQLYFPSVYQFSGC